MSQRHPKKPLFLKALLAATVFLMQMPATVALAEELALSPEDAKRGQILYVQCKACHTLKAGEPNRVGPNLHGMFGSKAAYVEGFKYSEALKNADLVWTVETMDKWLEKPSNLVPGTKMAYMGMKKKDDREKLIAYLKQETK
ncbi:c-type cytochrome [Govanella unica]|uniref:Cytochrome c family protein n=1 Tax=Govanella unica TaxID=2975056 RepID=A0A9X3TVL3_9PROT|nr:cytochrome c family protein [Govania unica]MDA5192830.1 cytochrome c family protein [Govania unica]